MDLNAFSWTTALSGVDFGQVFDGIYDLIPIVLPAVIGFLAFRKGWGWLKGQIKGA